MHTGGPEQHIRLNSIQIVLAYGEFTTHRFQFQNFRIQLFSGGPVTAQNGAAEFQQQPHQRAVADAQTQNCDLFPPQGSEICLKCRNHNMFLISKFIP